MDGWFDGWTDGLMDGWRNEWMAVYMGLLFIITSRKDIIIRTSKIHHYVSKYFIFCFFFFL